MAQEVHRLTVKSESNLLMHSYVPENKSEPKLLFLLRLHKGKKISDSFFAFLHCRRLACFANYLFSFEIQCFIFSGRPRA